MALHVKPFNEFCYLIIPCFSNTIQTEHQYYDDEDEGEAEMIQYTDVNRVHLFSSWKFQRRCPLLFLSSFKMQSNHFVHS